MLDSIRIEQPMSRRRAELEVRQNRRMVPSMSVYGGLTRGRDSSCCWPCRPGYSFPQHRQQQLKIRKVIPASDNGCAVDLEVSVGGHDHQARIGTGDITITNLENGVTYLQRSRHVDTETFDPITGNWNVTVRGKIWFPLYSGEPGPSGVVQEPGAELLLSGNLSYTVTSENVLTAFSFERYVRGSLPTPRRLTLPTSCAPADKVTARSHESQLFMALRSRQYPP